MGPSPVVVEPEPVQQFLEMLERFGWTLIGEPFFGGAVEPFEFPEGLWVIRCRVDPTGPLRLLGPILGMILRRQIHADVSKLKTILEN